MKMYFYSGPFFCGSGASTRPRSVNVGDAGELKCWYEMEYVPAVSGGGVDPNSGVIVYGIIVTCPRD